jgi:hypothetical protein
MLENDGRRRAQYGVARHAEFIRLAAGQNNDTGDEC